MELARSIVSGGLTRGSKRYSVLFAVDVTTSVVAACFWNKGYKTLAPTISLCCIGKYEFSNQINPSLLVTVRVILKIPILDEDSGVDGINIKAIRISESLNF